VTKEYEMTTGPFEPSSLSGPDEEDAEDVAEDRDAGIVERESELAPRGHDDRQANPEDPESDTASGAESGLAGSQP
jgi:hypothetical protein